jgi:hypothetical protein
MFGEGGFYLGLFGPGVRRKLVPCLAQHQLSKFIAAQVTKLIGSADDEREAAHGVSHRL